MYLARGYDRAIWSCPAPVDFNARIATLSSWLRECIDKHPQCGQTLPPNSPVAARVLEVFDEHGDPHLRLASTSDLDLYKTPYMVLSHCWGGVKIESSTTPANVNEYYTSIDICKLPKSFREAVQITRSLGLRYLWIDSLCIIQGSEEDWERESGKMAYIFRGATLTLSASTAHNSKEGCGISIIPQSATQLTVTTKTAPGRRVHIAIRSYGESEPRHAMSDIFRFAPVHKRAWIFQEKVLSHRILHATHSQFVYQCATHIETEDSIVHRTSESGYSFWEVLSSHKPEHVVRSINLHGTSTDVRYRWWHWAADYMERALTKTEDKYAAIAGVTALYQDLMGDEPVLGLWRRDLVLHLAWWLNGIHGSGKIEPSKEESIARRPSWTWLSYRHGTIRPVLASEVDWHTMATPATGTLPTTPSPLLYRAQVLEINIRWTGRPLVSSPSRTILKLRGYRHRFPRLTQQTGGRLTMDDTFIPAHKDHSMYEVFALFAMKAEGTLITTPTQLNIVWLVIEATGVEKEYRRVGNYVTWCDYMPKKRIDEQFPGTLEDTVLV